ITRSSPVQELYMVPSGLRPASGINARPGPTPDVIDVQAQMPVARAKPHSDMTAIKNGRKMSAALEPPPMRVLLAAPGGLFADAFSGSLLKLAHRVQVERCDPERLDDFAAQDGLSLVLIDADAVPGRAASLVRACRDRLPGVPV